MEKTDNKENIPIDYIQQIEEKVLKKIEIGKNLYARVITSDDMYIDFRKFHNGIPTKIGVRFKLNIFNKLNDIINNKN